MRVTAIAFATAVAALAGIAGIALATPPLNAVLTPIARGKVLELPGLEGQPFTVDMSRPLEVFTQTITIQPGGTAGWHSHPGPQFVVVKSGTVTMYLVEASCAPKVFTVGDAWIDLPGMVHTVTNEGTVPAEIVATGVNPIGPPPRTDVPAPWRNPMFGCAAGSLASR